MSLYHVARRVMYHILVVKLFFLFGVLLVGMRVLEIILRLLRRRLDHVS